MLINSYRFGDADANAYLAAVEAADGQPLEAATRAAITAFIVGCKADGIWTAIKASCILAGARTLAGALVPLVGAAPTNVGGLFVAGDYNRKTGLVGNGSTKYLNSNRNNNTDPQNSKHGAVYVSTAPTSGAPGASNAYPCYIGTGASSNGAFVFSRLDTNSTSLFSRLNSTAFATISSSASATGLIGQSRSSSSQYIFRFSLSNTLITATSEAPFDGSLGVFREFAGAASIISYSNARLAFYSIGESLDLALLDTRVTTLINAISSAF
jgi:hypothetical protein